MSSDPTEVGHLGGSVGAAQTGRPDRGGRAPGTGRDEPPGSDGPVAAPSHPHAIGQLDYYPCDDCPLIDTDGSCVQEGGCSDARPRAIGHRTAYEVCSECSGSGLRNGLHEPEPCWGCGGDVMVRARDEYGRFTTIEVTS